MNHKFILLVLFQLLWLTACKVKPSPNTVSNNPKVQKKLQELVETQSVPGLNFSIIYSDGQQENYAAGFSDTLKQLPLKTSHILFSGSIGKTYAVALLMQLVDEQIVDLNQKVKNYFPEVEWFGRLPNAETITVRMLLEHTSGLPRWIMDMEVWNTLHQEPDKVWTYKDRLSYIFDQEAVHQAGEDWAYSDTNYLLIGMLIEKICGKDYYDLLNSKILVPNQLQETYPSLRRDIPNLSVAYSRLPAQFKIPGTVVSNGKYVFNPQVEWTGGGLSSTTSDLAKWAKHYYAGKLFSDSLLQQITTINPNGLNVTSPHSYGMGSFIYSMNKGVAYGHSGFMPGYNSIFAYLPKQKMAIALQSNCDYASGKMDLVEYVNQLLEVL